MTSFFSSVFLNSFFLFFFFSPFFPYHALHYIFFRLTLRPLPFFLFFSSCTFPHYTISYSPLLLVSHLLSFPHVLLLIGGTLLHYLWATHSMEAGEKLPESDYMLPSGSSPLWPHYVFAITRPPPAFGVLSCLRVLNLADSTWYVSGRDR